jgi:hypothetical protein
MMNTGSKSMMIDEGRGSVIRRRDGAFARRLSMEIFLA